MNLRVTTGAAVGGWRVAKRQLVGIATTLVVLAFFGSAYGQEAVTEPAIEATRVYDNYKGLKIGSTATEVRKALGKPTVDDPDGFFYQIADDEFAQIRIDEEKFVRLLAVTFDADSENVPAFNDVFGGDADLASVTKPDGAVYKMVRLPEAGYWIAYSRTGGEDPSVTVTMQKLRSSKTD